MSSIFVIYTVCLYSCIRSSRDFNAEIQAIFGTVWDPLELSQPDVLDNEKYYLYKRLRLSIFFHGLLLVLAVFTAAYPN